MKLLTPGPVEVCGDVLKEMSRPMIHHRGEGFRRIARDIAELIRDIARAERHVALFNGTGTLATEAMIYSLLSPGDRAVVISHGVFGDRLRDTASRRGVEVYVVKQDPGEPVDMDRLKAIMDEKKPKAVVAVANETSTGHRLSDLDEVSRAARSVGAYVFVDAVSAFGGEEIDVEKLGIDALASCSHKALSAPPGVSFILLSDEAVEIAEGISRSGSPPPRYMDIHLHLESMVRDSSTPYTAVIPVFRAFRRSLENIVRNHGVDRWVRSHSERSEILYRGLDNGRIAPLIHNPRYRANTLTVFEVRDDGVSARDIIGHVESAGYTISPGMGGYRDRAIRIGTMGCIDLEDIYRVVNEINSFLKI